MGILQHLQHVQKHQRSANHLRTLPDHTLADLGIQRDQVDQFVRKTVNQ